MHWMFPWVGVNHLEAHVNSVFLEPDPPPFSVCGRFWCPADIPEIYHVTLPHGLRSHGARTRDDAAGEAFGQGVPKCWVLGLSGRRYDRPAIQTRQPGEYRPSPDRFLDKNHVRFLVFRRPLKTAVRRYIEIHPGRLPSANSGISWPDFRKRWWMFLSPTKIVHAATVKGCDRIGHRRGCRPQNNRLREKSPAPSRPSKGLDGFISLRFALCGDNAAMIAANRPTTI